MGDKGFETPDPKRLRVPGADGLTINVWDYGGEGPPLILCHCTGTHGRIWDPLALHFMEGYRVLSMDTRGHGDSDTPEAPEDLAWSHAGRDLAAVLEGLELGKGIHAIGHSGGATHIAYVAWKDPEAIAKAVLIDAIIGPRQAFQGDNPLAVLARRRKNVFESRDAARERYASKPPMKSWHKDCLSAYIDHAFNDRDDGSVELKCPGSVEGDIYARGGGTELFESLEEMALKALVVSSDGSDVRRLAEMQKSRLKNSEYCVIEGASHFIPQEVPEEMARVAMEWLSGVQSDKSSLSSEGG